MGRFAIGASCLLARSLVTGLRPRKFIGRTLTLLGRNSSVPANTVYTNPLSFRRSLWAADALWGRTGPLRRRARRTAAARRIRTVRTRRWRRGRTQVRRTLRRRRSAPRRNASAQHAFRRARGTRRAHGTPWRHGTPRAKRTLRGTLWRWASRDFKRKNYAESLLENLLEV